MFFVIEHIIKAQGQVALKWDVKVVNKGAPLHWNDCIVAQCKNKKEAITIAEQTNTFNLQAKKNLLSRF